MSAVRTIRRAGDVMNEYFPVPPIRFSHAEPHWTVLRRASPAGDSLNLGLAVQREAAASVVDAIELALPRTHSTNLEIGASSSEAAEAVVDAIVLALPIAWWQAGALVADEIDCASARCTLPVEYVGIGQKIIPEVKIAGSFGHSPFQVMNVRTSVCPTVRVHCHYTVSPCRNGGDSPNLGLAV